MKFDPTPEQQTAINEDGNILVAAAAGSGKTAVLVERVIKRLCSKTNGVSADRLLIVTFTNAAAAEMRGRIEKRLEQEILANPDDSALIMQKHLLSGAKICTIDSFCIDLVRENFEKLGVSPDFKISDGNALRHIDEKVLQGVINRYLTEKDPVFFELLDIIGAEYDDGNFSEFIYDIYNYSRQLPFPKKWFKSLSEYYCVSDVGFNENPWCRYAFSCAQNILNDCRASVIRAIDLLSVSEKAADAYLQSFIEASNSINTLKVACDSLDWDTFYNALQLFFLPGLAVVRGISDICEVTAAKDIYKYIGGSAIEKIKKLFYADSAFIKLQFNKLYRPVALLSEILIEYESLLFDEYKKANSFTFHNTEHLALSLLCESTDDGIAFKEGAKELTDRFEEVMVDEYQDTNDLQDMLFYVLSDQEKKLFAVGDLKQSIYGFRGANPKNFLRKKNLYTPVESAKANNTQMHKKIILGNNFRSKPEVCGFINYLFSLFMTESTGDIIYNDEEKLIPAAVYPETKEIPTQIGLINTKGSDLADIKNEGALIADYIKKTMAAGAVIKQDKDTLRNAEYSDFTVLLRSARLKAPALAEELKKRGIPVSYAAESFADSMEIAVFLSLLTVIDNPRSDTALLSVMMSPIFAFSPEELAKIRIAKRDDCLYTAVLTAADSGDLKAKEFLSRTEKYRLFAAVSTLPQLITYLLENTDYLQLVCAMDDGLRRRSNLLLLRKYADEFSQNRNSSIGAFTEHIRKQSQNGMKAAGSFTGGDSVRIMSIHASKGLQFPVCILAGLASDFNDSESKDSYIYSTESGIGFKYFDETDKIRCTTLGREVILNKIRTERLCEELRLLYVAMTRTEDRLFMTAAMSDVYKKADKLKSLLISSECKINFNVFSRTKSYADWLMLALLLHPCGKLLRGNGTSLSVVPDNSAVSVSVTDYDSLSNSNTAQIETSDVSADEGLVSAIKENTEYKYPYADLLNIESKASVSSLVSQKEHRKYAFSYKPAFMNKDGITPAQKGTAMHKAIEFFNFDRADCIDEELERLYEWEFISEAEYKSIEREKLKAFFASDIFARIKKADTLKREMRFLTEIPAGRLVGDISDSIADEKIIVQGAVDICFTEPDGIVILDFKTDRVDNPQALVSAYSEQLNIYAAACEKIFGLPIKQKVIYSFALSQEIVI